LPGNQLIELCSLKTPGFELENMVVGKEICHHYAEETGYQAGRDYLHQRLE